MAATPYPHSDLIAPLAGQHRLPASLIAAICKVESAWDSWAMRYEPAIHPRVEAQPKCFARACSVETERAQRATSWGLMQVLGETARRLGAKFGFLSEMCLPANGLYVGCLYLAKKRDERFDAVEGDWDGVIAAYNAGSVRFRDDGRHVNAAYVDRVNAAWKLYAAKEDAE